MARRPWLAILLLVALAGTTYGWVLRIGPLGHDTFPILAATRVEAPGELASAFREPYMDGRFRTPYYRPVLSLVFALDQALWGRNPVGLQLTNLLALTGAAVALFLLARRLFAGPGDGAENVAGHDPEANRDVGAPLLAALVFLLHPAHVASLPIASRRHDALCFVLAAWCLLEHLRPAALAAGRPRWRTGVLALLAMGTKETALVLPAASLAAVALYSPRRGAGRRLRHGAALSLPDWIALAVALAARYAVIGELGGPEVGDVRNLGSVASVWRAFLLPLPAMERSPLATPLLAGAAVLLLVAAVRLLGPALRRATRPASAPAERTAFRAAAFALAWLVVVTLPLAYLGEIRSWRLLFTTSGLALLLALAAPALWRTARGAGQERGAVPRAAAALGLLPLLVLGGWQLAYSPLVRSYPQWALADDLQRRFLADLERRIESTPDGGRAYTRAIPVRAVVPRERALLPAPPILLPRSVLAWCELRFPGRAFRLVPRDRAEAPFPAGVTVVYRLQDYGPGELEPGDLEPGELDAAAEPGGADDA